MQVQLRASKAEFARARQVLRKAVRRARARFRVDLIRSLNYTQSQAPSRPNFRSDQEATVDLVVSGFRNQEVCDVSEESGDWCAVQDPAGEC